MPLEFSSRTDGIHFIHNQIFQLDRHVQQTLAYRVSLLRQLNDIQSSESILANETLASIFMKACNSLDKPISPIVLGAVCSRWRRVAWDTPSLWSSIGPIPRRPIRPLDVEILRLYFQNTAQHPINLYLRPDCLPPKNRDTQNLLHLIFDENPFKVQKLTLSTTNSLATWSLIGQAIERSDLPNLSSVSFLARKSGTDVSSDFFLAPLFHSAINLRTLIFDSRRLPLDGEALSWSRITILRLQNIAIDQCLRVLSYCPKLVEYHCCLTRDAPGRIQSLVHSMTELRNLEILDVNLDSTGGARVNANLPWSSFLLAHFRFPNLKHMVWGTLPMLSQNNFALFFRTMRSLMTFKCTLFHHVGDLVWLLQHLSPTVQTVYLPQLSPYPEISVRQIPLLLSYQETNLRHMPWLLLYRDTNLRHLKRLVSTAIVPSSQGRRTLKLVFPAYCAFIVDSELFAILGKLREGDVDLEISPTIRVVEPY